MEPIINMYGGQTSSVPAQYLGPQTAYTQQQDWNYGMSKLGQQGFITPQNGGLQGPGMSFISPEQAEFYKTQNQLTIDQNNSFSNQYLKPASQVMGIAGGLANMYLGFQNLKTQKEYLGMAKEQWAMTKDEMNRIRGVRDNITKAYNS